MKKGCFIQIIIVVTILTAVIVYLVKNHFNELVIGPGKEFLSGMMMDEFDEKYSFVYETPEKDSLRLLLNDILFLSIDKSKKISNNSFNELFESIDHVFRDSLIDQSELNEIKEMARLLNERSAQN
jgi:uncharacterized membrane protein (DUF106 family)